MEIALTLLILLALAGGAAAVYFATRSPATGTAAASGPGEAVARFISGLTSGESGTTDTGIRYWVSNSGQTRPGTGEVTYVDPSGLPPKGI